MNRDHLELLGSAEQLGALVARQPRPSHQRQIQIVGIRLPGSMDQ